MAIVVALLGWITWAPPALAQEAGQPQEHSAPVSWGIEADVLSRYVWRGMPFSDAVVVWPSAWLSVYGLTLGFWSNVDLQDAPHYNEHDVSIAYERTFGRATLTGSLVRYVYRGQSDAPTTWEALVNLSLAWGPSSVFTVHAFDVDEYRGSYYVEAGYEYARGLAPGTTLIMGGSLAWGSSAFMESYAGLSGGRFGSAVVSLALARALVEHLIVRPYLGVGTVLDSGLRDTASMPPATAGVALTVEF